MFSTGWRFTLMERPRLPMCDPRRGARRVVRGFSGIHCSWGRSGERQVWAVVCDPECHPFVGVSRLSSNAAELNALVFAVRGISVAVQLEKEVLPRLDASFVSDNRYALGIMQSHTRAVTNHAQAQLARQWSWAARAVLPNRYRHGRIARVCRGSWRTIL